MEVVDGRRFLVEWDTGNTFGPASDEHSKLYQSALQNGKRYFEYPYHGYTLKMIVETQARS